MEKKPGRLISVIHRKVYQIMAQKLKNCDIDVGQFFFLRYLVANPGISQEEVAKNNYLDKATVSKGVKRLEELGYIKRIVNPKDKRSYFLQPTEKAVAYKSKLEEYHKEINKFIFDGLSENEYRQLGEILQKIVNNIEN